MRNKLVALCVGILVVGVALIALFWQRPSPTALPFREQGIHRMEEGILRLRRDEGPGPLPKPEDLGTVLPPGASAPAMADSPSPSSPAIRTTPGADPAPAGPPVGQDRRGRIWPTAQEKEQMRRRGAVAY